MQEQYSDLQTVEDRAFLVYGDEAATIGSVEDPVERMQLFSERLGLLLPMLAELQRSVNACVQGNIQAAEEARNRGLDTSRIRSGFVGSKLAGEDYSGGQETY